MTHWTKERDARLTALWNQTDPVLSIRLIGTMMDTTHNAIAGRVHRLPLPPRPSPVKAPNPNKQPRRAGKETFGKIVKAMATPVHPQTQAVITFEDWTRIPYTQKRERLPIPVGSIPPARSCQWPLNDCRPWRFCDDASVPGRSYCAEHTARAFNAPGVRDEPAEAPQIPGRVAMNARSWA